MLVAFLNYINLLNRRGLYKYIYRKHSNFKLKYLDFFFFWTILYGQKYHEKIFKDRTVDYPTSLI